jgi:hypothetical protein
MVFKQDLIPNILHLIMCIKMCKLMLFLIDIKYKSIHSVNIKFGTKFIVALCDVFRKIARTGQFYFEKCHPVMYNLFK